MKLINSVKKSRYKKIDVFFMDEYKWEFLANKYSTIANVEEWDELEENYRSDDDSYVLYGDVNGHSCLEILQSAYNYNEIERLFSYRKIILYTNENKDFHILIQSDY